MTARKKKTTELIESLGDNNWYIRYWATNVLVNMGRKAVPFLIIALQSHNEYVRNNAAYALGILGDQKAAIPLKKALGDEYDFVRESAREALSQIQ